MNSIRQRLFGLLEQELGKPIDPETVSDDQPIEDLGVSSLNLMNLIYRMEDVFGFTADTNAILDLATVGDIIRLIESRAKIECG
jgi:acyl carrier protein